MRRLCRATHSLDWEQSEHKQLICFIGTFLAFLPWSAKSSELLACRRRPDLLSLLALASMSSLAVNLAMSALLNRGNLNATLRSSAGAIFLECDENVG